MSREVDDLQKALDRDRSNHQLRLILADALQDSEDDRERILADGYRVLGLWRRYPDVNYSRMFLQAMSGNLHAWFVVTDLEYYRPDKPVGEERLPDASCLPKPWGEKVNKRIPHPNEDYFRRQWEDMAALTFHDLDLDLRRLLLNGPSQAQLDRMFRFLKMPKDSDGVESSTVTQAV